MANDFIAVRDLKACGGRVRVYQGAIIVGPEHIEIASDVIIDSGAILIASAECPIKIGNFVHIGAHSSVGGGPIVFEDFSGISHGVRIIGGDEDYGGLVPTNPTIPRELRRVRRDGVTLGQHVVVGANSVVMPGSLAEGVAIGACSFVKSGASKPWTIYGGVPAQIIGKRAIINTTADAVRKFSKS